MWLSGMVVHGSEKHRDAAALGYCQLGLICAREHAKGIAAVHLHCHVLGECSHCIQHDFEASRLEQVRDCLWRACQACQNSQAMLLDAGVPARPHGRQSGLHALAGDDLRPALSMDCQVGKQVQPLSNEGHCLLVRLPGVNRMVHCNDHRRDALRLVDRSLVVLVPSSKLRQTSKSTLLNHRVVAVHLHRVQDYRDNSSFSKLRLALLVFGQLRDDRDSVECNLCIAAVVVHRLDAHADAVSSDDLLRVLRIVS
mmetsp:Transcript_67937/g.128317  ORF Transcript_67937/g.128317 Transcript_67937/m.128317 type:complete len:254 (-) Transcript_67937:97-858(-)